MSLRPSQRLDFTRFLFNRLWRDHFVVNAMREWDGGDASRLRDGDAAGGGGVGRRLAAVRKEVLGQVKLCLKEELRNLGRFPGPSFSDEDDWVRLGDLLQEPENWTWWACYKKNCLLYVTLSKIAQLSRDNKFAKRIFKIILTINQLNFLYWTIRTWKKIAR